MKKLGRAKARENAFLTLFSASFGEDVEQILHADRDDEAEHAVDEFGEKLLLYWRGHQEEIDKLIESRLKGWKVSRISRVNLAVLRLAVAEMLSSEEDVDSIVINEAVELAKKFGDEKDYQFVNGVLGNISRDKGKQIGES